MSVITISRDFGSEGDYIAEKITQTLGYHFVDKKFFDTVLSQYGLVEFDREYDVLPGFWEKFDAHREKRREDVVHMLNRVVRAVAQHGNVVILGRSGFEVLTGYADIVHVRLQAPQQVRINRVKLEMNIPFDQAEEVVMENDKVHIAFVQEYYKIPWDAVHAFDLVINTGKVSPDLAASWMVEAINALDVTPASDKLFTSSIKVDSILKEAVADAINCKINHSTGL